MKLICNRDELFDVSLEDKENRPSSWVLGFKNGFARPLFKLLFRYEVEGKENIPGIDEPPVIFAANHVSYFDPPVIMMATYPRELRFLARASLFKPVVGGIFARAGGIPIEPESADRKAIKRAVAVLKRGECLGIFPEGTRMNRPDKEYKPHAGLILIAQMAKCKIVPVGISGTEKIKPYGQKLPRLPKVTVRFGEAISLDDFADIDKKARNQAVLNCVMDRIFALRDGQE